MARLRGQTGILNPTNSASWSVGETAPTNPAIGQRWFRLSSGVTYQYTSDGTTSFWLDISSGGIGTDPGKGVDFVGDTDPHKATNLGVVGSVYYNREKNRHFVCTTATTNSQVWSGRYSGGGGITVDYVVSGVAYRSHTFLTSSKFYMDGTTSVDYLVVAGGGGGGNGNSASNNAGGGGAGGFRTATGFSVTRGTYDITVGAGGAGGSSNGAAGADGPYADEQQHRYCCCCCCGGGGC